MISRRMFLEEGAIMGFGLLCTGLLSGCAGGASTNNSGDTAQQQSGSSEGTQAPQASSGGSSTASATVESGTDRGYDIADVRGYTFVSGSSMDRGFVVDEALNDPSGRTIHFSLYVPDTYNGDIPFALYIACPGWEGLYFQGVGANLSEDYPFEALKYVDDMIVVSTQLDDWESQSARDVISLTRWLIGAFNIDEERIYLSGCSGGGETISLVLGECPELYRRALHTISRWDGDIDKLVQARTPVYMAIGERDDYYGPGPVRESYERIVAAYREEGLSDDEIHELIRLSIKPTNYFTSHGFNAEASQHSAGGYLFAHDAQIMGWLFQ
ncbi:MAG: prolyl oligopeptidase family serine peptidase [Eggerthellaceae bacterium]|jgi:predicted peptidase